MGQPTLPYSSNGDYRTIYGYTFKMTPKHLTDEQMDGLKHKYDEVGTAALQKIDEIAPPPPPRVGWGSKENPKSRSPGDRDMYALLKDNADKDPALQKMWDEITTVPEWVDWEQIKRGQDVFYRYAPPIMAAFALQSLIGTTGSAARAAETLVRTGGHSVKVVRHRFFETFQLILQAYKSVEDIKPGGESFKATVRVRFLHASVRARILKLTAQRPTYFDLQKFGVPINDLDNIQSLCAFSVNLLHMGLPRQGIYVRRQEASDLIAVWRWMGHIIGAPTWAIEDVDKAHAVMESILYQASRPSQNSKALMNNALEALDGVGPMYAPRKYWEAGGRFMCGDQLCDDIGIGKPGLYYTAVMAGQCSLFMMMSYVPRFLPFVDKWKIDTFRKVFWEYLVESDQGLGEESTFEFKYQPQLGQQTTTESSSSTIEREYGNIDKIGLYGFLFTVALMLGTMLASTTIIYGVVARLHLPRGIVSHIS